MSQPANAAIYGLTEQLIPLDALRELATNAEAVTTKRNLAGKVTQFTIRWTDLQLIMNVMPSQGLLQHINGFIGYARQLTDGSAAHDNVIQQIREVKQVIGTVITPGWDDQGRAQNVILGVTTHVKGIFFAGNAIYNGANQLLLGPPAARRKFFITMPTQTSDSLARKQKSEQILRAEGVPYIDHLPMIEDEETVEIRSKTEIAQRVVALAIVASRGEGMTLEDFKKLVARFDAETWFTPNEHAAMFKEVLIERERIDSTWRYEACEVLLWALGYRSALVRPDRVCNPAEVVAEIANKPFKEFVDGAEVRSASDILDQVDLIYRYHWAVTNARLHNEEPPAGLEPGVVYERHYALNWLIGYAEDWDDISTDT